MMTERGTRRVNCNSKELKGGFLQHELWLGKKKKAEQSLATFGHQKQTEEKCEGEKEKRKSVP